jgi:hypothetical protein
MKLKRIPSSTRAIGPGRARVDIVHFIVIINMLMPALMTVLHI